MSVSKSFLPHQVTYVENVAQRISCKDLIAGKHEPCMPAGPLSGDGAYVLPGQMHTITIGRTGCGKTYSSVLPALGLMAGSQVKPNVLVVDAKPTCRDETKAIFETNGYKVVDIDLRDKSDTASSWNPLGDAWRAYMMGDAEGFDNEFQPVMDTLKGIVASSTDLYWENAAETLLGDIFEGLCHENRDREIGLSDIAEAVFAGPERFRALARGNPSAQWAQSLKRTAALPNDTLSCILGVANTMIHGFQTASVKKRSSRSTFSLKDFCDAAKPMCLFLISPDNVSGSSEYCVLLLDKLVSTLINMADNGERTRETQTFIDEFGVLPKSSVGSVLATSRSRKLYFHLAFQSLAQLTAGAYNQSEAKVLLQQVNSVFMMASNDTDAVELEHKLVSAITPALISSLDPGVCIAHSYSDSAAFRGELAPFEKWKAMGIFPSGVEETRVFAQEATCVQEWQDAPLFDLDDELEPGGSMNSTEDSSATPFDEDFEGREVHQDWAASFLRTDFLDIPDIGTQIHFMLTVEKATVEQLDQVWDKMFFAVEQHPQEWLKMLRSVLVEGALCRPEVVYGYMRFCLFAVQLKLIPFRDVSADIRELSSRIIDRLNEPLASSAAIVVNDMPVWSQIDLAYAECVSMAFEAILDDSLYCQIPGIGAVRKGIANIKQNKARRLLRAWNASIEENQWGPASLERAAERVNSPYLATRTDAECTIRCLAALRAFRFCGAKLK